MQSWQGVCLENDEIPPGSPSNQGAVKTRFETNQSKSAATQSTNQPELRRNIDCMINDEINAIKDFTSPWQFCKPSCARQEARAKSYATGMLNERAALNKKLNQAAKALAVYDAAIEKSPQYTTDYQGRSDAYTHQKTYQKALEDYTKAISINKSDLRLFYYRRATAYQTLSKANVAAGDLKPAKHGLENNSFFR